MNIIKISLIALLVAGTYYIAPAQASDDAIQAPVPGSRPFNDGQQTHVPGSKPRTTNPIPAPSQLPPKQPPKPLPAPIR